MSRAPAALVAAAPRGLTRDGALGQRVAIGGIVSLLALFVLTPTFILVARSLGDDEGGWVGLKNFARYLSTPRLVQSLWNTALVVSVSSTTAVALAFVYA